MIDIDLGYLPDYITAAIAGVGVTFAGIGLSTWKKQIKGTAEYELAKKLMLQVYRIRDGLQLTRNPFVSVQEGDSDDTEDTWEITAYKKRWQHVKDALAEYNVASLEAEVVWSDITDEARKDLLRLVNDLNYAISLFVRQKQDKSYRSDFYERYEATLYSMSEDDDYNKRLDMAVKDYEKILKPHLKQ